MYPTQEMEGQIYLHFMQRNAAQQAQLLWCISWKGDNRNVLYLLRYCAFLLSPSTAALNASYRQRRHPCTMVQVCLPYSHDCFCAEGDTSCTKTIFKSRFLFICTLHGLLNAKKNFVSGLHHKSDATPTQNFSKSALERITACSKRFIVMPLRGVISQ